MSYIYDLLCNFSKVGEFRDSYEWEKNDSIIMISKILIYFVDEKGMIDIMKNQIQVSNSFLNQIKDSTETDFGVISYACLVTDFSRVIALKFSSDGLLIERSSLLLDEEDAVIEEIKDFSLPSFSFQKTKEDYYISFLTRREKKIQNYLLTEIQKIYDFGLYDELDYLYHEFFSEKKTNQEMYFTLMDQIENHYKNYFQDLYDIIQMISFPESFSLSIPF